MGRSCSASLVFGPRCWHFLDMQRRAQQNSNKASLTRVRSSLMTTALTEGESRHEYPRRLSEIPVRSRSGTNIEALLRRQRKRSNSRARMREKRNREASDSQWDSSSVSSGDEENGQMLEVQAKLPPRGSPAGRSAAAKPPPTPPVPETAPLPPPASAPATPKLARSQSSTASIHSFFQGHTKQTAAAPVVNKQTVSSGAHGVDDDTMDMSQHSATSHADEGLYMHHGGSTSSVTLDRMNKMTATGRIPIMTSLPQELDLPLRRSMSTQSLHEPTGLRQSASQQQLSQLLTGQASARAPQTAASRIRPPGRIAASSIAHLLIGSRHHTDKGSKPVVSRFSEPTQSASAASLERSRRLTSSGAFHGLNGSLGRVVSVDVPPSSVFSASFVDRVQHHIDMDAPPTERDRMQHRYLLDYGLSGPPIDCATLSQAELTPCRESGVFLEEHEQARNWHSTAPRRMLLVPDSTTTLGPNMIPFHFIHALTSTLDHALALDHAEVPAMASLLPGVSERLDDECDPTLTSSPSSREGAHYIDNISMRAIAYTAQAVSVQRSHTVTRRFADPLKSSLGRVVRLSGYASQLSSMEPETHWHARHASRSPPDHVSAAAGSLSEHLQTLVSQSERQARA